ncbi:FAS1 domain-containing protein [Lanmaoa asiatica]|nr:FAS1 domain-containing protein [Lanmaoa asiatica]
MWPCDCIPLSLLALTLSATASQLSWQSHSTVQSDTLRARLIPTLNKLNGSTFFAPTNDAVKRHADNNALWQSLLSETHSLAPDNVQEQLRQQLFYHLLNYSLTDLPEDSTTHTLETLHFPQLPPNSSSHEPPSSPWFPVPHGLLGDQPQRLRLASRDGATWVGVDASSNGGAKLVKERAEATNGIVYGIAEVLEPPPDIITVVGGLKSLSYFQKVLTPEIERFLNSTPELTLFMPLDSAWESLDPLERLYLESDFAADDLHSILDMHVVSEPGVRWSDSFQSLTKLTTRYGSILDVTASPEGTTISGAKLVHPDVYASNGVLHLVSSLLVPPGALQLTPEKYLLALNCSSFVSLLHSVNLAHLINNTDNQYTILAPKDDVLSLFAHGLPASGSPDLKRVLEYHFLPGLWKPNKLDNGMLLETELHELGLDDGRQVMHVTVEDHGEKNDAEARHITFGGAGMIGEHVEINNTTIYFISRPLDPPVDPLQTALPSLDLSSFLAAVFSTSLADVIKRMPRTTFLIPHNSAFKRLGLLVSDHLLAASSKQDLEHVILHHIIDNVEYSKSLVDGSQRTFATLEGSDLQLERAEGGSILISASGGWAGMKSTLYPQNTLTDTGVIHEVSDLMIPRSVELNIGKLMKAGKATTMTNVMAKAGFDWILDGTLPPEGSEWADRGLGVRTWTLLCPKDDAFKKYNLTQLLEDLDGLRAIVSQHLIPIPAASGSVSLDVLNNSRPLPLDQLGSHSTLLSPTSAYGDIVFKEMEDKSSAEYMVGIKNARGTDGKADWARVLSWGRTTTGSGTGGVIQIDRLLVPYHPSWWTEYGPPSFVGAMGVLLICFFFYGARVFWNKDPTEATYEPVGGFGRDCDDS